MAAAPRVARRAAAALAGSVIASLLALLAAEALLGARLPARDRWCIWPPSLDVVLEPEPGILPGIEGPARFRTSSLGLRGPEREPGARTWLALGGSTTECLYLDEEETWPALLERQLNAAGGAPAVQVLNGGRSGRDLREHVLQLELLELELDAVLLLAGVNDLLQRLAAGEAYEPLGAEPERERHLARAFAVRPRGAGPALSWWRELALARGAELLRDRLDPDPRRLTQDPSARVYAEWRARRAAAPRLRAELPDLASALEEYRSRLHLAADLCAARGWRLALLTQPCLWRADMPAADQARLWMGWIGEGPGSTGTEYYSAAALERGMQAYDQALRGVAAERGLLLVDLATAVPHDPAYFADDVHASEAGARAIAGAAAAALSAWTEVAPAGAEAPR